MSEVRTAEEHLSKIRGEHSSASAGGLLRQLVLSLGAYGGSPNLLWLLNELRDESARASFDRMRILADFRDADRGAAAVAEHDSFLRNNPHLMMEE